MPQGGVEMKAIWNGMILAESDQTIEIEGNRYFPPDSIRREYFENSNLHTTCVWKGEASYYSIRVRGALYENGAWYYPAPSEAAARIKNYVAFYGQVQLE